MPILQVLFVLIRQTVIGTVSVIDTVCIVVSLPFLCLVQFYFLSFVLQVEDSMQASLLYAAALFIICYHY